jgi:hypothetical protein
MFGFHNIMFHEKIKKDEYLGSHLNNWSMNISNMCQTFTLNNIWKKVDYIEKY